MSEFDKVILEGAQAITPYITAYGAYKSSLNIIKPIARKLYDYVTTKYYDISEIHDEMTKGNIRVGDVIETDGFFMEYAQIFKPYTYVRGMGAKAKFIEPKKKYVNGKFVEQAGINMTYQVFQPPIQKIPDFNGVGCAFIYDTRFKGFMHESNKDESTRDSKPLIINEFSKPIMLLYSTKYRKYLNKDISLRARIIDLPIELAKSINGIHSEDIKEICSNFIDLTSEMNNFICLTLLDDKTDILNESAIESLEGYKVPLFVEAQLTGLDTFVSDEVREIVKGIIPDLPTHIDPQCPIEVMNSLQDNAIPFISTTDTNIILRNNVVGFYTYTNIYDRDFYGESINSLSMKVKNFGVDYKNLMKKEFGQKERVSLTFLHDYKKQMLFDIRGVLESKESESIRELNDVNEYIIDWLREQ